MYIGLHPSGPSFDLCKCLHSLSPNLALKATSVCGKPNV